MGILDDMEIMRLDDRAPFLPGVESQQWKKFVVKGDRDIHVPDRDLDMVDNRLHACFDVRVD